MVQPRYDLVSNALNNLSTTIGNIGAQRDANRQNMRNLDLQKAQLGLSAEKMRGEQDIARAKMDRDKYMNETLTIGQIIDSKDNWRPEVKQAFINQIPEQIRGQILQTPVSRAQFAEVFRNGIENEKNRRLKQQALNIRSRNRSKQPSAAEMNRRNKLIFDHLRTKYGLQSDDSGNILPGQTIDPQKANAMQQEANRLGFNVNFQTGQVEDTGAGWNPFDNKIVETQMFQGMSPNVYRDPNMGIGYMEPVQEQTPTRDISKPKPASGLKSELDSILQRAGQPQAEPPPSAQQEQKAPETVYQRGNRWFLRTKNGDIVIPPSRARAILDEERDPLFELPSGTPQPVRGRQTGSSMPRQRGY